MSHPLDAESLVSAAQQLAAQDSYLAAIYQDLGPPPLWGRREGLPTLVRIILEQQVSLAAAKGTYLRLKQALRGRITATGLLGIGADGLRDLGFSRQKARYALALAERVRGRQFSIPRLRQLSDDAAHQAITELLGFGGWSADIYLMMALRRPDVLPTGDLGLIKGIAETYGRDFADAEAITAHAESWRPYRAVATRMIWQNYLVRRGQDPNRIAAG